MIVAGIDPGLSGAIAILNDNEVLWVDDLPVHQVTSGNGRKRAELNLGGLVEMLQLDRIEHVVIEQVGAMPKQGVTGMFRFGYCAGAIAGIVAALKLPYSFVLPQTWQRVMKVGPSPDAARQRAGQLYPSTVARLVRKKDGGRADAILIARHYLETKHARTLAA